MCSEDDRGDEQRRDAAKSEARARRIGSRPPGRERASNARNDPGGAKERHRRHERKQIVGALSQGRREEREPGYEPNDEEPRVLHLRGLPPGGEQSRRQERAPRKS